MTTKANEKRAEYANRAITIYQQVTGADKESAMCDLLCDLMHWANEQGQVFYRELARAEFHYTEDLSEGEKTNG